MEPGRFLAACSGGPATNRPASLSSGSIISTEDQTVLPGNSPLQPKLTIQEEPAEVPKQLDLHYSLSKDPEYTGTGEEASENSIIWHTYNDEASRADTSMVEEFNREIDVLLVFTGLFSAVLTTFIIQAYQMVLPDPTDETNELLSKLLALQLTSTGLSTTEAAVADETSNARRVQVQWVNGLWFSALACSLSAALISMLAKQWLHVYTHNIFSGSPRDRARKRQNRFMHLRSWHVLTVISLLPLLLHAALFLFFSGIVVMLWSGELVISLATIIVVALAYIFYTGSMCISLVSPDCPYQHPISAHLHHWLRPSRNWYKLHPTKPLTIKGDLESCELTDVSWDKEPHLANPGLDHSLVPTSEDILDATALIWLLKESTGTETVISNVLQAIAGLPRDFTAYQLLRQAGAVEMILERFESCFQLDSSLGIEWYIKDPHVAEKYCRAWLRLTYQTKLKWPARILQPLRVLRDFAGQPDIKTTATCILALASLEKHAPQGELLSLLSRHVGGQVKLSWSAQREILDALLECIALWELPAAAIANIVSSAVPLLVRLLQLLGNTGSSAVRQAIHFNLYALTGNFLEPEVRRDGKKRRNIYWQVSIKALADIVRKPESYGVIEESLLDIVALELGRFANVLATKPLKFSPCLRDSAKAAFTSLYLDNHITRGGVSESMLADILHLLHPPRLEYTKNQSLFTYRLINTLKNHKHPNIICNTLRLLDTHLSSCHVLAVEAFLDGGGLSTLLRIANTGSIDGRRLQMDSLRTLCTFVRSSAALYLRGNSTIPSDHFDAIFQSDFFKTLCLMVTAGKWWLPDAAHVWAPALVCLCQVRPGDPSWRNVEKTFWKYANLHQSEIGQPILRENLQHIRELRRELEGGAGKSFFEDDF